jgi:hypothetical protein
VRCQSKVALLEVPPTKAFSILSVLSHHPVCGGRREKKENEIMHEIGVNRNVFPVASFEGSFK